MFLEDQWFLDPGSCFWRTLDFYTLAHVFRGPRVFGSWLMFSDDFWTLAHVFRGPKFWYLGSSFQRTKGF